MSGIRAQLREIEREEKRRLAEARRLKRQSEKSLKIIRKRADPTIAARRLLGVERRRARKHALVWIGLSVLVLILAANYLYHTLTSWWPSHTPLPQ